MAKKPSYFRQSAVLTGRYFRIFFGNKQNLLLDLGISLLTILIVALVASGDMYVDKNTEYETINEGYPVLTWEAKAQGDTEDSEEGSDDNSDGTEDKDTEKESEEENDSSDGEDSSDKNDEDISVWDGELSYTPVMLTQEVDDVEYYLISSAEDLVSIMTLKGEYLDYNYMLTTDIDLDNYEWTPIGSDSDEAYTGIFDGNGHVISNLNISEKNEYAGMFGYVKSGEIKNLGVDGVKIDSESENAGAIAGQIDMGSKISDCFVRNGTVVANNEKTGTIIGSLTDDSLIDTCYSRAELEVRSSMTGGMAGYVSESTIQYTYFAGLISNEDECENVGVYVGESFNGEYVNNYFDSQYCGTDVTAGTISGDEDEDDIAKAVKTEYLKSFASKIGEDGFGYRIDSVLSEQKGTQTGLFMLICVAIFVGICNSIQEIIKERSILKREYMTNLRLDSYVTSKLIVQATICAIQILIITVIFYLSISDKLYPTSGVVTSWAYTDFYITMFLTAFAADVTALFISSIVKSSVMANTFIPIILIVQIVFSGVLFELGKTMDVIADIMISKWGIAALSAISHLNESRPEILLQNPEYEASLGDDLLNIKSLYAADASNVLMIWGILIVFIVVFTMASRVALTGVKKDKR